MRVTAYVLVGDPNFLADSIRSYYPLVDRIVLSYDEDSVSWTGTPLPVEDCLRIIDAVDVDGKCVRAPGHYARLEHEPLANETFQRQAALDAASQDADWVLQLDTDEVMLDPDRFLRSLRRADATGCSALDYPSRWLYARVSPDRYLEASSRFWRPISSYPGPLAVRAGTRLSHARQVQDALLYRVDLRAWNTDPAHHHETTVHEVVPAEAAVLHYSWVRDHDTIRRKFGWSGHAADYSRPVVYRRWASRQRHPWRTVLSTPLRRRDRFRLASVPAAPGGAR